MIHTVHKYTVPKNIVKSIRIRFILTSCNQNVFSLGQLKDLECLEILEYMEHN